ncbi:MAG: FAD-dependent oxidoreductase, partial [Thermoanaerobaculia bacterium]|nr:FAD-dependent oxidoreductase [Thermoanaerobaculia bacterium]
MTRTVQTDVVVVGAGMAGMRAALALAPLRVVLVTKARLGLGGSSPLAQGGIAAAIGDGDAPSRHAADPERVLTESAAGEIAWLAGHGTSFDRAEDGTVALAREGGHRRRRVLHAGG